MPFQMFGKEVSRGGRTLVILKVMFLVRSAPVEKFAKLIHRICFDKLFKAPKCEDKWADFFEDMNLDWGEIYQIPTFSSRLTKLRYFQLLS